MKWGLLVLLIAAASAQQPTFRTRAREVIVPVSVTTKTGKPVEGLSADDFVVLSDGNPQQARMVSNDATPLPIYAVVVLQIDGASEPALAKIKKTASIVSAYITNDMDTGTPSMAAVVTAGDEVKVAQQFTADANILDDTFAGIQATGSANRLIDGVSLACDLLVQRSTMSRRVIVVIGESRDLGSKSHFANIVVKAQKSDIVIYTVSYSAFTTAFTERPSDRRAPPDEPGLYDPADHGGINLLAIPMLLAQRAKTNVAAAFAESTGGSHQKFTTLHSLEAQLTTIGTEIHNRYILSFIQPKLQPPGYHELSVSARKPETWKIHARTGYWSGPE